MSDRTKYSGVCYSEVCFHIFHGNSAGRSNVVRYDGFTFLFSLVYVPGECHRFLHRGQTVITGSSL